MKTIAIILAAASILQSSCSADTESFSITLSGKSCNNLTAKLYRESDTGLALMDSTRFEMQKAHFEGRTDTPELMYIYIDNATDYLPIFVENSRIDIDLNYSKPAKSVITGSESNKIFTDFLQAFSMYSSKETGNLKILQSAYNNHDTLMIENLEKERNAIRQEISSFQRLFIKKYIDHPIACYILSAHLMHTMPHDSLQQLADSIPPENRDNIYYRRILAHLEHKDARNEAYDSIATLLKPCRTTAERITTAAKHLVGRPYTAGTLDNGDDETIITDLTQFDCVTFQETCLALAIDAGSPQPSFENFRSVIENLRYRDGRNTGYCSRLHYTTDWLAENARRGNIEILTDDLGGIPLPNKIKFMSTHSNLYRHLNNNPAAIDSIRQREKWLDDNHALYIPKSKIAAIADRIPDGSLIFITTNTAGLDFAHVGIAIREDGALKIIHASSTSHRVTVSPTPLPQYLEGIKRFTGIAVAIPK